MDPRRLMVFRAVARAGSLSGAARELGWTQPAVSQHLARLERDVAQPLVLRGSRGVSLTEAGVLLLARADAVAAQLHHADEELASLAQASRGRLRVVAFPTAAATVIPDVIRRLRSDHPGVTVGLVEAEPPEAWASVRAGEADVALVFGYDGPPPDEGDLVWTGLFVEPVDLVVSAERDDLTRPDLGDLADETWIAGCPRCRQHLVATCVAAGFTPKIGMETDDYVTVQNLVAAGLGVTMLPRSALRAYLHPGVVVRSSERWGSRHVGVIHRPGADQVPAIRAFLERLVASG